MSRLALLVCIALLITELGAADAARAADAPPQALMAPPAAHAEKCSTDCHAADEAPHLAMTRDKAQSVAVRPLDDPANPYLGQYAARDRWLYDNWVPWEQGDELYHHPGPPPPGTPHGVAVPAAIHTQLVEVDAQGWLIPSAEAHRRYNAQEPQGLGAQVVSMLTMLNPPAATESTPRLFFFASGEYPAALKAERDARLLTQKAQSLPPIPAWLMAAPPVDTMFVPNGDVLCFTPAPGNTETMPDGSVIAIDHYKGRWTRYDAAGKQLADYDATKLGMDPLRVYFPGRDALVPALDPNAPADTLTVYAQTMGPYVVLFQAPQSLNPATSQPDEIKILGAYYYDGTPVDPATVPTQQQKYGQPLQQAQLVKYYAEQQRLGLTDMASAGSPATVPAAAPAAEAERIATSPNGESVTLRPLDDPANPYRGQYSATDSWIYEHWVPAAQAAQLDHRVYLRTARDGAATDRQLVLQGIVDAQGWMVPWAEVNRREREQRTAGGIGGEVQYMQAMLRPTGAASSAELRYSFTASGLYLAALQQSNRDAATESTARNLPPIPAWLASAPPTLTVFGPGGEVLGFTPRPGDTSFGDGTMPPPSGNPQGTWRRYDSAGKLLGEYDSAVLPYGPMQAYFPQLSALAPLHSPVLPQDQPIVLAQPQGPYWVLFRTTFSSIPMASPPPLELLGAYRYDGVPVDPSTKLTDQERALGMVFVPGQIKQYYAAQLRLGLTK